MIDEYRMSRKSDLRSRRKMMALLDGRLRYTLKIVKSHFQNDGAARR